MDKFDYVKGLLVTGINEEHPIYSVTNSNALMVVTDIIGKDEITVFVLDAPSTAHIHMRFDVDKSKFIPVSLNEWKNKNPYFTLTTDEILNKLKDYGINIDTVTELSGFIKYDKPEVVETGFAEISPVYTLKDEERKSLLKEITKLLLEYGYHPTYSALNKILDEWIKNKGYLINLISKHPNYNGKFQIAFSKDYDRKIDSNLARKFGDYLNHSAVVELVKPRPIKLGCYEYREVVDIIDRINMQMSFFNIDDGIYTINNRTKKSYQIEKEYFEKLKKKMNTLSNGYKFDGCPTTKEEYMRYGLFKEIRSYIRNGYSQQFVDEGFESKVNSYMPELKIVKGQKMSKAINKIMTKIGVAKDPYYNREFAKYSDAINPLKIKRHTVLSVHPVDYLTMSFGNSWASFHTIDKANKRKMPNAYSGCYSSGTMSYMLDNVSMIFYTVDAKASEHNLELEDKINRNMFHYDKAKLIQGRIYPQDCDSGCNDMYEDFRNVVQKIVADCLEVDNLWNISKGYSACADIVKSHGTHYRDYTNYSNCNVSTLKMFKKISNTYMHIGHNPICPSCGYEHTIAENIECRKSGCKSNRNTFYCTYHDRDEDGEPYYTDANDENYCREAVNESEFLTTCHECGTVIDLDNDDYHTTDDGYHLCPSCYHALNVTVQIADEEVLLADAG